MSFPCTVCYVKESFANVKWWIKQYSRESECNIWLLQFSNISWLVKHEHLDIGYRTWKGLLSLLCNRYSKKLQIVHLHEAFLFGCWLGLHWKSLTFTSIDIVFLEDKFDFRLFYTRQAKHRLCFLDLCCTTQCIDLVYMASILLRMDSSTCRSLPTLFPSIFYINIYAKGESESTAGYCICRSASFWAKL